MRKTILYIAAATALMLTSCNDLLDKSPRDTFTNTPSFWDNENLVSSYSNAFYNFYGGASSTVFYLTNLSTKFSSPQLFYFNTLNDDQVNPSFQNWTYTTIPASSTAWSNRFTYIRSINYLLDNLKNSSLPEATKNKYEAIARMNRAQVYSELVKMYGDVQWEDHVVLSISDEATYGERDDADKVMENVLADLDFAIATLPSNTSDRTQWSKEMALAMKSDICLYWGTYCKYRTQDDNGKAADMTLAKKFLDESVKASEAIMSNGFFQLNDWTPDATGKVYTIYNSLDLAGNKEAIFYRHYAIDVLSHGLADYTSSSTTQSGITKDCVDAFLFKDGKPKATTICDTLDRAVKNANGNWSIQHFLANKDKRLSLLVDSIISFKGNGWIRNEPSPDGPLPAEMTSSTGYTVYKYDNPQMTIHYRTNTNTNYTDVPVFWYPVVLLNEAEAKAELGTITKDDLDKTVNLLLRRAGLPDLTMNPDADPANDEGVSNLLWEIRRCRRCELVCDKDYRYWDLVRWHQLDKLDTSVNTDANEGANVSNVEGADKDAVGYLKGSPKTRQYNKKYYLYPIPTNEIELNSKIHQNLNWQ